MSYLSDLYKQEQAQRSSSALYRTPGAPPPRRNIYVENAYSGLQSYQATEIDPLAQKPGESAEAWRRRVQSVIRHLPEDEAQARLASIEQAQNPQTAEELRAHLATRQGSGTGVFGNLRAQDRAAALGSRGFGTGREVRADGALAAQALSTPGQANPTMTSTAAYAIARQREAEARGQIPQRQEIPAGSSGDGWMVAR